MAWSTYPPNPWSLYKPPKPKKKPSDGWRLISASRGTGRAPGFGGGGAAQFVANMINRTGGYGNSSSSSDSSSSGTGFDPYPAYNDPYGSMLSQLAALRDSQIAQLRGDLTGREAAIKKLYADQVPLVEGNYNQAIKESAATQDAVHNVLTAEGGNAKADLLSKLSSLGAPQGATDAASNSVGSYYSGLAGANYAMDAGDVQRLIGRLSEEKTYLAKQPGIIAADLESQYQAAVADVLNQYAQQQMDISQQQASALNDYNQSKFQYEQDAKQQQIDNQKAVEAAYWDNYWKKQDLLERKYEIAVASKDKRAQLQAQKDMKNMAAQAQVDVANIRAGASVSSAQTRANATVTAASIRANATRAGSASGKDTWQTPGSAKRGRVITAVKNAILRPDGRMRTWNIDTRIPSQRARYNSTVIAHVNAALRAQGVDPNSPAGRQLRNQILSEVSGVGIGDPRIKQNQQATYSP